MVRFNPIQCLTQALVLTFILLSMAQACDNPQYPKVTLQWDVRPINYELDLLSRNIPVQDPNTANAAHYDMKGLFTFDISYGIQQRIQRLSSEKTSCILVQDVLVTIKVIPKIYIAKELQGFPCMLQNTKHHEVKHYNNLVYGLNQSKDQLQYLIPRTYKPIYIGGDRNVLSQEIDQSGQNLIAMLSKLLEETIGPLNRSMDTEEAYHYESSLCSSEANAVDRAFNK